MELKQTRSIEAILAVLIAVTAIAFGVLMSCLFGRIIYLLALKTWDRNGNCKTIKCQIIDTC